MPYFCKACWELSSPIEPEERCLHCFQAVDEKLSLCPTCRKQPLLPFPRAAVFDSEAPIAPLLDGEASDAIAGFAYHQWLRLDWKAPDYIVPLRSRGAASAFAELMGKPCPQLICRTEWPPGEERFEAEEGLIEEGAHILLFDEGCCYRELEMACEGIVEVFPKRVEILSVVYEL